jgi:hypothetical protein
MTVLGPLADCPPVWTRSCLSRVSLTALQYATYMLGRRHFTVCRMGGVRSRSGLSAKRYRVGPDRSVRRIRTRFGEP